MACSPPCLSVGRRTSWGAEAINVSARDALATSLPAVLLFDCDGMLVDTEKVSHHISFNETFAEVGFLQASANASLHPTDFGFLMQLLHTCKGLASVWRLSPMQRSSPSASSSINSDCFV
ncbi:hypothetical protein GUJ93_ZPchr0002g24852 [Zizania palustris]|uniref:Uncharacterized protein n=1 Tax=Zizania palustris TaxID=103762 RepID=A0A8J5VE55_ZIZPA|nr:hypothetical protein GUJ93_ZPchr0002g24852 [Zizania palustris]